MARRINKDKIAEVKERIRLEKERRTEEAKRDESIRAAGRMNEKEYRIQKALGNKFKLFRGFVKYQASTAIIMYSGIIVAVRLTRHKQRRK